MTEQTRGLKPTQRGRMASLLKGFSQSDFAKSSKNLSENLKLLRQSFIHTTKESKVRELHQQLDSLVTSSHHNKESLFSATSINYIKYLARVHGLPPSYSSLLIEALGQSADEARHKLKLIQVLKYSVNHNNDFVSLTPLFGILSNQFPIDSLGRHDDFFHREAVSQLFLVIMMLANPDNIMAEKILPASLNSLQGYMPYVNGKYKSRIKSSLERLGYWQDVDGSNYSRSFNRHGNDGNQSVKTGFQVIQSAHKKNMAKNGSRVQAHAVKTQQTEAVTTEENVSQKTQMRSISLANALEASRTKSRSLAANQGIELNAAKRADGSDRCWWKTTSWEVTNFLEKAKNNGTISDDDIVYLRNTYGGYKFSFTQSDITIKNMVGEIFSRIAKNQMLDLPNEADATTVNMLLENVAEKHLINKLFDAITFQGHWTGHIKSVLEATQLHCARRGKVTDKTKELLENIRDEPRCNKEAKNIIWHILSSRDDCLKDNFAHSLLILKEQPRDAETALEYIGRQTVIESKCEEMDVKFGFIPNLVDVVISENSSYTPKAVQAAVEIIEAYLSMDFNSGLSVLDVEKLINKFQQKGSTESEKKSLSSRLFDRKNFNFLNKFTKGDKQSPENVITAKIIRCILLSLDKNIENQVYFARLPGSVLECLVEASITHPDLKLQAFVLAGLVNLINNDDVFKLIVPKLNNIEVLAPKLFRKDLIYFDGRVCLEEELEKDFVFEEKSGEFRGYVCISAAVARLFLVTIDPFNYDEILTTQLSKCLCTHPDNQTRIYCSEYLFSLARSGIVFTPVVLSDLRDHCHDPVPDIHVYCTAAYCTSISNFICVNHGHIPNDQLTVLAGFYSIKTVLLGNEDFTSWINPKIIDVFHSVSKPVPKIIDALFTARNPVSFTEEMFQVLAQCLSKNAEINDPESLKTVEKVLQTFENLSLKDYEAKQIPSYCIETIENLLLESDVFDELCARIIERCMMEGRWVSDQVLEEFDKYLIYSSETSIPFLRRLFLANNNQELPDQIFDDFQMELIGLRLLQTISQQKDDFLEKNGLDKAEPIDLLECLGGYLSRGRALSPMNMNTILECLKQKTHPELVVQSLTLASTNGQSLSKETIQLALQLESISWPLKVELATAVVGRNQLLPDEFLKKIYKSFTSGEDIYGAMQLITALIQNNYSLPTEVLRAVCHVALNRTNENCFTPELLSALVRLAGSDITDEIMTLCKEVFLSAINSSSLTLIEMGIHGLENFPSGVLTKEEITKIQNCASQRRLKFSPHNSTTKKPIVATLTQEAISDEDFFNVTINYLEACTDKGTDQQAYFKLGQNETERLQNILSTSEDKLKYLGSKLCLSILTEKMSFQAADLYSDLIEAICFSIVNTISSAVKKAGHEVIKNLINTDLKLSPSAAEYLMFLKSDAFSVEDQIVHEDASSANQESNLRNLVEYFLMEPENKTLASKLGDMFEGVSSKMCLDIITSLSNLRPEEICAIPNVVNLVQDYVEKVKPDDLSQCMYVMDSVGEEGSYKYIKELVQAGALYLLESMIKIPVEKNIEIINLYWDLLSKVGIQTISEDCLRIAMTNFTELTGPNQMACLSAVTTQQDKFCATILLEYLANEPNSAIKGAVYCALESIEDATIISNQQWIACTNGIIETVFGVIYQKSTSEEKSNLDKEFKMLLLMALHSAEFWDLQSLLTTPKSKWVEHILLSDAIERFAQSENDKLEMYPMLQTLLPKLLKNPVVYFGIWTLLDDLQDFESVPILIELLNEFTEDELSRLTVDNDQWLFQVQTVGLAKKLAQKCNNMSTNAAIMFGNSLLQALNNEVCLTVELVNALTIIDSCFDIRNFLQFLAAQNVSSNLALSIRQLKNLPAEERNLMELQVLIEMEFVVTEIPKNYPMYNQLKSNLKILLRHGYNKNQLQLLLPPGKMSEASNQFAGEQKYLKYLDMVENITFQIANYEIKPHKFEEITVQLKESDHNQWIKQCNNAVISSVFSATGSKGQKRVKEMLTEFFEQLVKDESPDELKEAVHSWEKIIDSIQQCKKDSNILPDEGHICTWDAKRIYQWSQRFREEFPPGVKISNEDTFNEMLMVTKQAYVVWKNLHLTSIQILSLMLTISENEKGCLLQAATGSGKSTIIAVIAVLHALQGIKVDIYTSSPVLAERDSKEWAQFYRMFGLTCDHNGDTGSGYTRGEKGCYKKDIVYGETSQFQFDTLRDEYSGLHTRAKRGYGYSIVDEVDSMLIDDSSKLARLSSTLPGMDLIQILYHITWERLHYTQSHLLAVGEFTYYLEGRFEGIAYEFVDANSNIQRIDQIDFYISQNQSNAKGLSDAKIHKIENNEEMETFVAQKLKEYLKMLIDGGTDNGNTTKVSKIELPKNFKEFARSQIDNWVESALTAITFQENIHYIVDENLIKPVDFATTGVIQSSTNWNNGLHQFLQIKHSLRITTETVTTNFLSNMAIFKKYGSNIVGFTGTLGSDYGRSVLEEVYSVKTVVIPELYFKRFYRLPDVVTSNEYDWLQTIVHSALNEASKGRGVLVISQTIKQAEQISDEIFRQKTNISVKLYVRNDQNQEKQVERIRQGDIIIATNLAGRGTDIKTPEIEDFGGMHVIVTFLPESLRVEEQAFGRTSRQGKQGTGQLIVVDPFTQSSKELVQRRDDREAAMLKDFVDKQLKLIQTKDKLFQKFSKCFLAKREYLRKHPINSFSITASLQSSIGSETLTVLELTHLQAIEEKWAMFLKSIDDGHLSVNRAVSEYNKFENEINQNFGEDVNRKFEKGSRTISSANNCFYWIQYANEWYKLDSSLNNNAQRAYENFQEAIDQDAAFSAAAYVGQAYVLLKGDVTAAMVTSHDDDYKTKAVIPLRTALKLLYEEIGIHTVAQTFLQQRTQRGDSDLFTQLTTKINLLGTYTRHIEGIINTTERSLRKVFCTGISSKPKWEQTVLVPNKSPTTLPIQDFNEYHLDFNNLTFRYDSGTIDQAVETIQKTSSYFFGQTISLKLSNQKLPDVLEAVKDLTKVPFSVEFESLSDIGAVIKILKALKSKEFTLGVSGSLPFLEKVATASTFQTSKMLLKYVDPKDTGTTLVKPLKDIDDKIDAATITGLLPKGLTHCKLEILFKEDYTYDFEDDSEVEADDNVEKLEKYFNKFSGQVNFSVEIDEPNPSAISKNWEALLQYYGNNKLNFVNMGSAAAEKYIVKLREKNSEFVLSFQNLQEKGAKKLLEKAVRTQEEIKQMELKEMSQQYSSDCIPLDELRELAQRGIILLATFNERAFIPWRSVIAVGILASVQVGAGAVLICTGFGATVGLGLITEGMADFTTAGMAAASRNFDWSNYAKQKAISLTISCVSMGLSSLKDGAKGVQTLAQGALNEAGEQAGTKLLMNGKTVGQTIKITSKNLKTLAFKQIGVQAGENVARAGLNALVDSVVKFSFDQVKVEIEKTVDSSFKLYFYNDNLQNEFKQFHGVNFVARNDKRYTTTTVMKWVNETTNPQSSFWSKQWDSVGWPLCRGILSDPKYLGSPFSLLTRAAGIVNGMREIVTIIEKVCTELQKCLVKANESATVEFLLQCQFNLCSEDAKLLAKSIDFKDPRSFEVRSYPSDLDQFKDKLDEVSLSKFFKDINSSIVNYKPDTLELSQLRKSIVDAITSHIIHTADRQLISPISTYAVGSIVANVSQQIQSRLLVSEEQYTPEQEENKKKAEELRLKPEDKLTTDEKNFLRQYRTPTTIREQIMANADAHNIAYQQRDIIIQAENQVNSVESHDNNKISQETFNDIVNIAGNGPADTATIMMLSKQNNLNVKIVDDPDYVPTQAELDAGIEILVYEKPTGDCKVGHYLYKDKNTGELVEFSNPDGTDTNNCAYNILEYLSGKPAGELRCDAAKLILKNPETYKKVQESKRWIESRHPNHANAYLGVGGARKISKEERGVQGVKSRYIKRTVGGKKYKLISKISGEFKFAGEKGTKPERRSVIRKTASDMSKKIKENTNEKDPAKKPYQFRFTEFGENPEINGESIELGGLLIAGHVFNMERGGLGNDQSMIVKTASFNRTYNVEFEEPLKAFTETFPDSKSRISLVGTPGPYGTLDAIDNEGSVVASIPICKNLQIEVSYTPDPCASEGQIARERSMFDAIFQHLGAENGAFSATFTNTGSSERNDVDVSTETGGLSSDDFHDTHGLLNSFN